MTDKALENAEAMLKQALERKKAIQAELIGLDDQIGQITRFVKTWHLFAEADFLSVDHDSVTVMEVKQNKEASAHTPAVKRPKNSSKEDVADLSLEIIRERQEPVPRSELFQELMRRGMSISGKDPEMVLSTMLWRMRDRIVRLRTGGYWERSKEWPDAGYSPETTTEADEILHQSAGLGTALAETDAGPRYLIDET